MAESVNRVTESPETEKGLLSGIDHQQLLDRQGSGTEDAEDSNVDPNDLSRYERLCRFFSRRRERPESTADLVTAVGKDSDVAPQDAVEIPAERVPPETPAEPAPITAVSKTEETPTDDIDAGSVAVAETDTPAEVSELISPAPAVEKPLPIESAAATAGSVAQPAPSSSPAEVMPPGVVQPPVEVLPESQPVVADTVEATPAPLEEEAAPSEEEVKAQRFGRIKKALAKTSQGLGRVFLGKKQIDDDLLEELETQLLTADLGFEVTTQVIDALTERARRNELNDVDAMQAALKALLVEILQPCEMPLEIDNNAPFVLMAVGVNGVGKTTTIGKLARLYLSQGKSVMLAAGDTFRAAAVEQLQVWGERNQVPVIAQHTGADSASVIYDAVESAKARNVDLLIADTAGRLHTKSNLMDELTKIRRVVGKLDETAPHEVLLVLDAGTGQNAVTQLKQFHEAVGVTGIVLTKLDGTAKGGVVFALCSKFGIPVRFIGVGESAEDLQPFRAAEFVDALLASN